MDRWSGLFGLATLCHLLLLAHSLELRRTTEIEFHSVLSSPQSVQYTLMRINYSIPDYWLNIVAKLTAIWKFHRHPNNSKRHLSKRLSFASRDKSPTPCPEQKTGAHTGHFSQGAQILASGLVSKQNHQRSSISDNCGQLLGLNLRWGSGEEVLDMLPEV